MSFFHRLFRPKPSPEPTHPRQVFNDKVSAAIAEGRRLGLHPIDLANHLEREAEALGIIFATNPRGQ
jgi:hypothetical protein